MTPDPTADRLRSLARWTAQYNHGAAFGEGGPLGHIVGPFETCPHPDCVLLRAPEAAPPNIDARTERLLAELENIANVEPAQWDADVRDQFQPWAQNRARSAVAAFKAAPPTSDYPPEQVQLLAWAAVNCHTLARRALAHDLQLKSREKWEHVLRICEKAGARSAGVLRMSVPTELTEGAAPPPPDAEPPRTYRERPIALLRDTLALVCRFVWNKRLGPGEHLWTIPVDEARDFDCIISDAIDELEARRAASPADAGPREDT